jgi:hypothetical protein
VHLLQGSVQYQATVINLGSLFLIQRPKLQGTVLFIRALPSWGHRIRVRFWMHEYVIVLSLLDTIWVAVHN